MITAQEARELANTPQVKNEPSYIITKDINGILKIIEKEIKKKCTSISMEVSSSSHKLKQEITTLYYIPDEVKDILENNGYTVTLVHEYNIDRYNNKHDKITISWEE